MSIYIYRLSQWIEKKFNAKGGNVITDMESVARTVVSLPIGVEDRYLNGWNRFALNANVPAVAAQFSRARLRNPTGSNVIAVIEKLSVTETAGTDTPFVTWGPTTTDLASIISNTATRIDPRGNPQPTVVASFNQQAAGGVALIQFAVPANTNYEVLQSVDQELTLLPGQVIDVQCNTANQQILVNWMWREHALELSELT